MDEDYFDDASDADFLALAQQVDPTNNGRSNMSNRPTATVSAPRPVSSRIPSAEASTSSGPQRPETPKTNPTAPKVLRPGFNAVIVNTRQATSTSKIANMIERYNNELLELNLGNPLLEHIRNVPWEYGDVLPDYVLGATTCALFLSLRYHRLHPEYIYNRIHKLGKEYNFRILLIMVDIDNHSDPLRELTKTSLVNDYTVILAWSAAEAGRYLETFKAFEHANSNLIKQHQATDYPTRLIETLTTIRSVNKNDAVSIVTNFGSLTAAINAPPSQIATLGGWGPQKIERFEKTVTEPFIIKTGTGGAIGLGKQLKGGRWMVDQEGADALDQVETYANAGNPPLPGQSSQQRPMDDERMPDEWNRDRNKEGDGVGFIGQRPIIRPKETESVTAEESGGTPEAGSGVMAALARLRQQERN